jgi:hypothetical protein
VTKSSIEASSRGVKLSYLRFISDSAPGFVVLLILGYVWRDCPNPPWWVIHKEFRILFGVLSLLLATPLGLLINAVSYFLLGHIQTQINRICFLSESWPLLDARRSLMVNESIGHFGFTADNWEESNQMYGEIVESYRPDLSFRIEHLRGLKRFARSISFLSFIYFFCLRPLAWHQTIPIIAIVALWFFWLAMFSRDMKLKYRLPIKMYQELWVVILFGGGVLISSARIIGVTWETIDVDFGQICILALALLGLLVAGMVNFYQRATIAMYLHIECPPGVTDSLSGIINAVVRSAKRLQP